MRNTRSIIDRYLPPRLGSTRVRDLTTVAIDEFYVRLRTDGCIDGQPLSVGTVYAHAVLSGDRPATTVIGDLVAGIPMRYPGAARQRPSTHDAECGPPGG